MILRLLAALAILSATPTVPALAQAEEQVPDETGAQALPSGTSSFAFAGWPGPRLEVWAHVPDGLDAASAPIVIVMHGQQRDADRYIRQWSEVADACGFIAIAPEFSRGNFRSSREYNLGHLQERGSDRLRPREQWSFTAIEPLFDAVVARLAGTQEGYTLYGHSAGAQFVHRFALIQRDTRARRFIAANAGWYTLPTFAIAYPFGLGGTGLEEADLERALASDMVILLGEEDTDPAEESLNRSEGAMMQGEHRFARGRYFTSFGAEMARRQGWDFGWSARGVPGVAHDNGGMARAAGTLVAGVGQCAPPDPGD